MSNPSCSFEISPLRPRFNVSFSHASATRSRGASLWVVLRDEQGGFGVGEGCPRSYVTGETLETALAWAREMAPQVARNDLASFRQWRREAAPQITRNPAAWCALELAHLDWFARRQGVTLETLLGVPDVVGSHQFTAVVGGGSAGSLRRNTRAYLMGGFRSFKIKLTGDLTRDQQRMAALRDLCAPLGIEPPRLDANNLWPDPDTALRYLDALPWRPAAIEEPLREGGPKALSRIARTYPVVLDEALCSYTDLERHLSHPGEWIPNLRVSKLGGVLESIALAQACEAASVPFIVGGHVGETSLMTRAALTVARSAKGCLAQEGGFGVILLRWEPVTPAVMFGHGGRLEVGGPASAGWGMVPRSYGWARASSWVTTIRGLWRILVTRRPWRVAL